METTSSTGATTAQNSTMAAVIGSPCAVICQIPCRTLASMRTPNRCRRSRGSDQAKGMSNSIARAMLPRRVSDQSRPSRTFALQRGHQALWLRLSTGKRKSMSHCVQR